MYRLGRSEDHQVDRLVERLVSLAQKIGDPDLLCIANLQVSPVYQGRLLEARQILIRASQPRDIAQQRSLAYRYGMAPSVVALAYLSHCHWLLGEEEQAMLANQEALHLAEKINIPMTSCYALGRASWQHVFTGQIEAVRLHAEKLLEITRQHEIRSFELAAHFLLAWVKVQSGDPAGMHIESMYQLMQDYKNLGTILNRTTFLLLFAQVCVQAEQFERGLSALDEAICLGEQTGERWFEAEAYRLKGELLLQKTPANPAEAEICFTQALQVARAQQSKSLELRAALSLARLLQA